MWNVECKSNCHRTDSIDDLEESPEAYCGDAQFPLKLCSQDDLDLKGPTGQHLESEYKNYLQLLQVVSSPVQQKDGDIIPTISLEFINKLDTTQGAAPLHYACMNGHLTATTLLLEQGAAADIYDERNQVTPLICAAAHGNLEIIQVLLEYECDLDFSLDSQCSALYWAVVRNHPEVVRFLLAVPYSFTTNLERLIHTAVEYGLPDILEILLTAGKVKVKPDFPIGSEKYTPLHMAAMAKYPNSVEVCKVLIQQDGTLLNSKNALGQTPLHLAATSQQPEIVKIFPKLWDLVNAIDNKGRTPLFYALGDSEDGLRCLQALITAGNSMINHQDNQGYTALHVAGMEGLSEAAEVLLKNGADFSIKSHNGHTALNLLTHKIPQLTLTRLLQKTYDESVSLINQPGSSSEHKQETKVNVDLEYILPSTNSSTETGKIKCLVDEGQQALLLHPVIHSFLELKWRKARIIFLPAIIFNTLLVLLFSFYVLAPYLHDAKILLLGNVLPHNNGTITSSSSAMSKKPFWYKGTYYTIVTMAVIRGLIEVTHVYHSPKVHLRRLPPYISCAVITIMICYMSPGHWRRSRNALERSMAALAILLTWVDVWIDMSRLPNLGLSIRVFLRVFRNFGRFMLPHVCLLAGFVMAFTILFPENGEFGSVPLSVAKIIRVMAGDITIVEEGQVKNLSTTTTTATKCVSYFISVYIFTAFVLVVAIVLANMLVGLAANDIQTIFKDAAVDELAKQTTLLNTLESNFGVRWIRKWMPQKFYDNYLNYFHGSEKHKVLIIKPYDIRDSNLSSERKTDLLSIGNAKPLPVKPKDSNRNTRCSRNVSTRISSSSKIHAWKNIVSKLKEKNICGNERVGSSKRIGGSKRINKNLTDQDSQRILIETINKLLVSHFSDKKLVTETTI